MFFSIREPNGTAIAAPSKSGTTRVALKLIDTVNYGISNGRFTGHSKTFAAGPAAATPIAMSATATALLAIISTYR
jgi:hypothetical protein